MLGMRCDGLNSFLFQLSRGLFMMELSIIFTNSVRTALLSS